MSIETRQLGSSSAPSTGPHYEDFWVGRRVAATHRPTTPPGDGLAGAEDLTTFLRLASDSGVLSASVLRVLETQWRDLSSSAADGAVEATFTVTGLRRIPAEGAGSVQWHALVRDGSGRTLQEGSITVLLPSLSDGSTDPAERDFCTRPWAEALARRLAEDEGFRSATSTWDGCIGLRAGGRSQVQLRIYRGRIIEVAARTPLGATFTLEAADHVWTDLMTGPSNDFFHRAMSGDSFTVTGNVYEYLRLSKALMALIDAARELAMGAHA